MRLIRSSFEVLPQAEGLEGMYKQIEIGARNCYKSEDKITDGSAEKMVEFLKNRGHYSPLEHGTVYLSIPFKYDSAPHTADHAYEYITNKYSKVNVADNTLYITTNFRVLVENDWLDDLKYLCEPTEYHEKRISVMITCPIGISREFNRHRTFSISEQSTRYCNYSKDKFNGEVTYVIPQWASNITPESVNGWDNKQSDMPECTLSEKVFLSILANDEAVYLQLIEQGKKPQEARDTLPLATATTVMYTGFVSDWKHFFELRTSAGAHPDARAIAIPLMEEFETLKLL